MRLVRLDVEAPSKVQRTDFDCGEPSLDRWLVTQARQSMESRDAVTYLLLDDTKLDGSGVGDGRQRIVGYYCLSGGEVRRADAPSSMARRSPDPIPAIRMGRFAIDVRYQGQGWGADLLREALLGAVSAGRLVAARVMLVDAISERAHGFYLRFGFTPSPIHRMQVLYDLRAVSASAGLDA